MMSISGVRSAPSPSKKVGKKSSADSERMSGGGMGGMMSMGGMNMGMGMMHASACISEDESDDDAGSKSGVKRVRVGNRNLVVGKELVEMTDSTALYQAGEWGALKERLEEQGFLFIRGVIPQQTIQNARTTMLKHLHSKGAIRDGTSWEDAYIEYEAAFMEKQQAASGKKRKVTNGKDTGAASKRMIPGWTVDAESGGLVGNREPDTAIAGWYDVGISKALTSVYNGDALHSLYTHIFGAQQYSALPSCTWLRAKGPGEVTAEHADYYYFYKFTHIFSEYNGLTQEQLQKLDEDEQFRSQVETCQICNSPDRPEHTLICDVCNRGYHIDCLSPPIKAKDIPAGEVEWHCHECTNLDLPFWTCWVALGNINGKDGRLALVPGTHRLKGYESPVRPELLPADFTPAFEQQTIWHTPSEIHMGDIILFNIKTIHAATRNGSEKFRLSLDTRVTTGKGWKWQQEREEEEARRVSAQIQSKEKEKEKDVMNKQQQVNQKKIAAIKRKPDSGLITAHFNQIKSRK